MTKLPETIKVKVHSVIGKTEEELKALGTSGFEAFKSGRASGRTTAIILKAIGEAQLTACGTTGNCIASDHYHFFSNNKSNADNMRKMALDIISKLGLRGFTVKVVNIDNHPAGRYGIHIKFHTWTEAVYDLRK